MEIDLADLNKELAEWSGFKYTPTKYCEPPDQYNIKTWEYWICPDGKRIFVLNFTNSLDACFKYLTPKIIPMLADIDLSTEKEAWYKLVGLWLEEPDSPSALALCLVIKKLKDASTNGS